MDAAGSGWKSGGSLDSRFFADDGIWKSAPLLTGQGSFEPLPDVKNILVTGGEGFIASWLVRHLVTKYPDAYNIVSFDKLDYCSSLNNARMLEGRRNFRFFHGDLTVPSDVLKCLRTYAIDTIFHLAAQSHVDLSFGNSLSFTHNNMAGTHVLLESVVQVGTIKRLYHISTDEVYGEVKAGIADLTEKSVLAPTNPYAASKASAEMMVRAYQCCSKLPAAVVRLNNVYGPHQFPEKIIPKFINLLQRGKPLYIHGDGTHKRNYLYAGDAADAFDTILHKGELDQIYNVDSKDEFCNLGLAGKLCESFGVHDVKAMIEYTKDRPFNDYRYAIDGSKLRKLGWTQRVSFKEGLAGTIDWYSKYSNWWGDVDGVLVPFPEVVNSKRPDGSDGVLAAGPGGLGWGGKSRQAKVGASVYDPESAASGIRSTMANGSSIGLTAGNTNGSRKRKADELDGEHARL